MTRTGGSLWSAATWHSYGNLFRYRVSAADYHSGDKSPHSIGCRPFKYLIPLALNRTNLMKTTSTRLALLFLICVVLATFSQAQQDYPPGPDSTPQPGVPKGEVLKFSFERSQIFPGTVRDYWVYVPAQYTPDKPACLYVNQDGIQWQAPTVFDNLIYKKEMPVTIGVFVMHGRVTASDSNAALDRFNRSYEYDGLGDNYVRFLLDELLPEVESKKASDGRPI